MRRVQGRVLVFGHASVVPATVTRVCANPAVDPDRVDVLMYGRASPGAPLPPGIRVLPLPLVPRNAALAARAFLAFVWKLRSARYQHAVLAQPALRKSAARGALVAFPLLVGAREVEVINPDNLTQAFPMRPLAAVCDLLRFAAFTGASFAGARPIAFALRAWDATGWPPLDPPRAVPRAGPVLYLRTDSDLALTPLEAGGSLAHTEGVLSALARRGHPVELWSTGPIAGSASRLPGGRLPAALAPNLPRETSELVAGIAQFLRLRRLTAPAFVYQRHSLNNLAGLLLARKWQIPLVLEANASEAQWRADWSTLRFPALAFATERLVVRRADRVAVVSKNAAYQLAHAEAGRQRLRIVPNGVAVDRFSRAKPRTLPFSEPSFVICFTGLFYPWHGASVLAEAFSLLRADLPEAKLLLVGDGEERPLVEALLRQAEAGENAHFTGLVPSDSVPEYLASADVVVSPHRRNDSFIGSPIKLWEYMASGRAIVASDVAQIGEMLRNRTTALLVPPDDPSALANALFELHCDLNLRARLGRAAQAEASEKHSWDARLERALNGSSS